MFQCCFCNATNNNKCRWEESKETTFWFWDSLLSLWDGGSCFPGCAETVGLELCVQIKCVCRGILFYVPPVCCCFHSLFWGVLKKKFKTKQNKTKKLFSSVWFFLFLIYLFLFQRKGMVQFSREFVILSSLHWIELGWWLNAVGFRKLVTCHQRTD